MPEQETKSVNPLNFLLDTFWAVLPEKTANDLAGMKKIALLTVKDMVDWVVTQEIEWTEKHLENARKMREQYQKKEESAAANG